MRDRKQWMQGFLIALMGLCVLAAPGGAQDRTAAAGSDVVSIETFSVLSYNTLNPSAAELRFSYTDPARTLVDVRVDNEAEFDQRLAAPPDAVTLVTDQAYALRRHVEFLGLAGSFDINFMIAVYGDLDDLEQFALDTLGVSEIADRIAAPGTQQGMLIVQYLRTYNFAYLLGEETYNQGGRSTYPSSFPITRSSLPDGELGQRGPVLIWVIGNLIRAALEEPFWNRMHYLSGETLGCLGVDWDTAFRILWRWEVFEQWLNGLGFRVGEDIWGIIWDLIWGMVGYIDGATGW